jgi:hypothetical protein
MPRDKYFRHPELSIPLHFALQRFSFAKIELARWQYFASRARAFAFAPLSDGGRGS